MIPTTAAKPLTLTPPRPASAQTSVRLQSAAPGSDSRTDWKRLWREAVRDPGELLALLGLESLADCISDATTGFALNGSAVSGSAVHGSAGNGHFPLRVPRGFVARMRHGDPHDPLLRQVLPLNDEQRLVPGFVQDAVGDRGAHTAAGVLQKYRGRALLVTTGACAVHCRYCFRRHFPYGEQTATRDGWHAAIETIRADITIDEVILSGGDPLSLATAKLAELTAALADIPHIKRLRIHTRLPVVLPERVDPELLTWLDGLPWPVAVVIHANHANEFDACVDAALDRLRRTRATLLNQAVLLRGVNDSVDALAALSERAYAAGVVPYYLHQLDRVAGSAHFEVPDATALSLHAALSARLSGYLVPRLVREMAGDSGKRPLSMG